MTTAHPSPDSAGADPAGTGPAGAGPTGADPAAPAGTGPAGTGPTGADPAAPAGTSPAGTTTDPGYYIVARTIAAAPPEVFALLTDPARHHETEPTDWVRGPLDSSPVPITEVGQVFGIEMFHENAGGRYDMHNRVIAFEPDRTIAWEPGQHEPDGTLGTGGWTWRYDLAPDGVGTRVTITYDWSAVPPPLREEFGLPPFAPEFLEQSLEALDRALTRPPAG